MKLGTSHWSGVGVAVGVDVAVGVAVGVDVAVGVVCRWWASYPQGDLSKTSVSFSTSDDQLMDAGV